jgi:lambda repressor-like predicted transcriptional regulator
MLNNMLNISTKIKIELLKKGITGAAIARSLDITRSYVSHVIAGRFKSKKVRRAIADALGMRVEQLWPENTNKKAA